MIFLIAENPLVWHCCILIMLLLAHHVCWDSNAQIFSVLISYNHMDVVVKHLQPRYQKKNQEPEPGIWIFTSCWLVSITLNFNYCHLLASRVHLKLKCLHFICHSFFVTQHTVMNFDLTMPLPPSFFYVVELIGCCFHFFSWYGWLTDDANLRG